MRNKGVLSYGLKTEDELAAVCKALSSTSRIQILRKIVEKPAIISDLAAALDIPMSTMTMHIRALEEVGLISVTPLPGSRGSQKLCGAIANAVHITIIEEVLASKNDNEIFRQDMPIGNFFDYDISPPCGLASEQGFLGPEDDPDIFSQPDRFQSQIIWMSLGHLEYRFPNRKLVSAISQVKQLEFSLEICSETFDYDEEWKSDVFIKVNGRDVGIIECPGDHGGRRGRLNPDWWPANSTQFGDLHRITLSNQGCAIDGRPTSALQLKDYGLDEGNYISLCIGVDPQARYAGGMNLFGEKFGDYAQGIVMRAIG